MISMNCTYDLSGIVLVHVISANRTYNLGTGLVVVDRNTVTSTLGDVSVTLGGQTSFV